MERIYLNGEKSKYFITEDGKVISSAYKGKVGRYHELKDSSDHDGYRIITLNHRGKKYTRKLHRLVADAYIPNLYNLPQVNHIDGDKSNNTVDNLEWVDSVSNIHHAMDHNLRYSISNPDKIMKICDMLENTDKSFRDIANECGVSVSVVTKIKEKQIWKDSIKNKDFSKRKKKVYFGEENPSAKVTKRQVHQICRLLVENNSPTVIAKMVGVPRSIIYKIRDGKTWASVSQYYIF